MIVNPEEVQHLLILDALDSATEDCPWGRLVFDGTFDPDTVYYIYVFAQNENSSFMTERYRR